MVYAVVDQCYVGLLDHLIPPIRRSLNTAAPVTCFYVHEIYGGEIYKALGAIYKYLLYTHHVHLIREPRLLHVNVRAMTSLMGADTQSSVS